MNTTTTRSQGAPPLPGDEIPTTQVIDTDPDRRLGHQHKSTAARIFGIGLWGWVRLVLICLAVGILLRGLGQNPFSAEFSLGEAFGNLVGSILAVLRFIVVHGWLPALIGAVVVIPIWILWRLVSLPFRK